MISINDIHNALVLVASEYGIVGANLFGSYARGEQDTNSDIDIVIELSRPLGFKRAALIQTLQDSLGIKIDVVFGADQLYMPVRESYEREKISVYEA